VAVGTAIPVVFANLLILLPAACRQIGVGLWEFVRLVATGPLIGAVPAAAFAVALRTGVPPASLWAIFVEGALVGALYIAVVCAFGFDAAVRTRYIAHARRVMALSIFTRSRTPRVSSAGVSI
jgi:hypothetical protein